VDAPEGSRVELRVKGMPLQVRTARRDASYLASSSPRVIFAVRGEVEELAVVLVGGKREVIAGVKKNGVVRVPGR
jgi:hypothetical protein